MNVVLTGRDPGGRTRAQICRLAGQAGHMVVSVVNSSVHYLVASRFDTKKAAAAERRGVSVISYQQFFSMCSDYNRGGFLSNGNHEGRVGAPLPLDDAGRMAPMSDLIGRKRGGEEPASSRRTAMVGPTRRLLDL